MMLCTVKKKKKLSKQLDLMLNVLFFNSVQYNNHVITSVIVVGENNKFG